MSAAAPPPTPTVIARRYELQRMLAQGGMAEVWLAIDLTLDRKVAVKWLKPTLAGDPVVTERFRREAIAAASLNHPNIVAVHDVFEQDGRQAVVMQLVEGKSLRQLLDTQKRLSPELTCHIGTCVAAALDHAHDAGFVHRDVKPGNIMITSDGRVLLTDFGIAKGLQTADTDLTSDNIMMGTAKYLSPEQVRGKKLDGRADLYSLGLVLYECLAGRVPFLGETDADTALARLQRDPTDLSRLRATLPTSLVITIHQLLARNPTQRPPTGATVVTRLREAAQEGPPPIDETPHERSPVSPFGTRRLRRAPSDIAGRATDRHRAVRSSGSAASRREPTANASTPPPTPRPLPQRRPIPGEVVHTGLVAATTSSAGSASGSARSDARTATTSTRAPVDHTPADGAPRRGRPAKGLTQGWKPSFAVLALLIAIALVVAMLLWASLQLGSDDQAVPSTVVPPVSAGVAAPDPTGGAEGPAPGPAAIATITAYDPDGDGQENNNDAALAIDDGDPATAWRTVCYSDKYMGAKKGTGLVVSFDDPTRSALTVDVLSAPYQVEFFTTDAEQIPPSFADWGPPLGTKAFGDVAATVESAAPVTPARHTLILLEQLGPDDGCTSSNPYRGSLGEIRLTP